MAGKGDRHNLDLFGPKPDSGDGGDLRWPDTERFPLNVGGHQVANTVRRDLLASTHPLIVTGYTGLDQLIDFVAECDSAESIRLLFGQEPFPGRREEYRLDETSLPAEVERYWLKRGISLLRCAALLKTIEQLKSGRVQARYVAGSRFMHAKIYCADQSATVGSSNFTFPGLHNQYEANARFHQSKDPKRFEELNQIAENYWQLGRNYNPRLIDLLKRLLKVCNWQEALARACAELLEGEWAELYLRDEYLADADTLWPSQKQGIAQALYILSNQGSVLVADATGAGKTRMGTYLIGAVRDHILRTGRMRQGKALMICPPAVEEAWMREAALSSVPLDIDSHGKLSHSQARHRDILLEALKRAQVLCVDEGHNFLNFKSNRTQQLLRNMADHVVLLTATPINKGVSDLLRIADLLGADNLEESTLKAFQKFLGVRQIKRSLTETEVAQLKAEIQKFTVRRTKRILNRLIDRKPDAYRDADGERCRFPRHKARVYRLNESDQDRKKGQKIKDLADQLHGVTHFRKPVELPYILEQQGVSEERYLLGRLISARKLSRYMITSALRSSRPALLEHILGTQAAIRHFEVKGFSKSSTGNTIRTIERFAGKIPDNKLSIDLPDWLSDPELHLAACEADIAIYERIARITKSMSGQREVSKAELLSNLLKRHDLLLAFDSRPLTLAYLKLLLEEICDADVLLGWGDSTSDRDEMLDEFARGSEAKNTIGLCSDSLAEGVNLQQASVLVHLDMPSVVRIAEQRVGRVDRMDSPHPEIEAWWPQDAPEFAISSDERLVERFETVERLLGSNTPLPEHLQSEPSNPVSAETMIEAFEAQTDTTWDGIDDAFAPVRGLIEGEEYLVDEATYETYRQVKERVLSRISIVRSHVPWAFFCLSAGSFDAPRWVLLPSFNGTAMTDLKSVADGLRERLSDEVENLDLDEYSSDVLERFVTSLVQAERSLLARKKRRALSEMEHCIKKLIAIAQKQERQEQFEHLEALRRMLATPRIDQQPNWDEVATLWLDMIRPVWFKKMESKQRKPLVLRDIRKDLLSDPDWLIAQLEEHFQKFPLIRSPEERIRACILGVS